MGARMTTSGCTILVSWAGRRVALIGCFRESAGALGIDLTVIATDLDPTMSAACQVAERAFSVPRCDSAEFPDRLLEICRAHLPPIGTNVAVEIFALDLRGGPAVERV
jgi:hypothetical protein